MENRKSRKRVNRTDLRLTGAYADDGTSIDMIDSTMKKRKSEVCSSSFGNSLNYPRLRNEEPCSSSSLVVSKEDGGLDLLDEPAYEIEIPMEVNDYQGADSRADAGGPTYDDRFLHPLMIPEIMDRVFHYLNDSDDHLLSCQSVCLLWNGIVTRILEMKQQLPMEISPEIKDPLFERMIADIPKHRPKFGIRCFPTPYMEFVCKNIGSQMKNVHILFGNQSDKNNYKIIQLLAAYCSRLDDLSVEVTLCQFLEDSTSHEQFIRDSTNLILPIRKLRIQDYQHVESSSVPKFVPVLRCPYLRSLSYTGYSDQFVTILKSVSEWSQRLERLKNLDFYCMDTDAMSATLVDFITTRRWNLENLKIRFRNNVNLGNIRIILHHLRETLVAAKIEFDYPYVKVVIPDHSSFYIPLTMPKLRSLEIYEQTTVGLVNAMHLPNLKSLVCYYRVNGYGTVYRNVWDNDHMRPRIHNLESLTILENSLDVPLFQGSPDPFMKLKILKLDNATNNMLRAIFGSHPGLEILNVGKLQSVVVTEDGANGWWLEERTASWDEVLTGWRQPEEDAAGSSTSSACFLSNLVKVGPSVSNLARLRNLSICFDLSRKKLTDFSIYYGLAELRMLQHLRLNEQEFSSCGIAYLSSQLVPFCRLELTR